MSTIFFAAILIRTLQKKLSLDDDLLIRWHGIGGRTVSKTKEYDLCVVEESEEFVPNVVIMQ